MGPQHHCCGMIKLSVLNLLAVDASMGPQHHCCGMARQGHQGSRMSGGFNGAATSLLRNGLKPNASHTLLPSFNGAATSLLRNGGKSARHVVISYASMGPQHHCCGMSDGDNGTVDAATPASMGPQHHCCGMIEITSQVSMRI